MRESPDEMNMVYVNDQRRHCRISWLRCDYKVSKKKIDMRRLGIFITHARLHGMNNRVLKQSHNKSQLRNHLHDEKTTNAICGGYIGVNESRR